MALPRITATGNLTKDPDLRFTASGVARTNLSIACNDARKTDSGWEEGEPTYLEIVAWRNLAQNVVETLNKGDTVTVTGRLRTRKYEKDGETRSVTEVDADSIALDLKRHCATVQRVTRRESTDGVSVDPWATPGAHDSVDDDDIPPF